MAVRTIIGFERPSSLTPAFEWFAQLSDAHALCVGQIAVQGQPFSLGQDSVQREQRQWKDVWTNTQVAAGSGLDFSATKQSTTAEQGTTAKRSTTAEQGTTVKINYNGTTSAKGAGMAKSLARSGGVPPRGRPV